MKKLLSLLLIMVMMFSLVACGSNNDEETTGPMATDPVTTSAEVNELDATISVQVEATWLEYYEAVKARVLETYPSATIEFIEVGSFDHLDTLDKTDVTNTDVADVFALPADRIYGLAQNQALAGLDAQAMATNVGSFADYDGGLGGNFNIDGEYLAFPMNIETLITFANTANAAASNIDLSGTVEFADLDPESMLIPIWNAWYGVAVTNSADIELLGKDESGALFSDLTADWADLSAEKQAVMTAIFEYWKAHDAAGTPLWDENAAWGYMDEAFTSGGQTAMRIDGPWSTGGLSNLANTGADLNIIPITQVTLNGTPLTHWKGGWGLGINARVEGNADQMMLAQKFIEEVVNTDFAVDFFNATGKILENVDPSVYLESEMTDENKAVVASVIASYQDAPARPLFTEWGPVWDTWKNGLLSWSAVKPATVEAAYAEVQASFKAMMLNF